MVSLVCTLSSLKMERVPMLFPYKPEFVYPIVLIKALLFELGCGSPGTGRCITLIGIFQQGFLNQDLHHPLGILLPVGDKVEVTARLKLSCKKRDKITLDEPSLMVLLLRPGVGEEDVKALNRAVRDHVLKHIDRIEAHEFNVLKVLLTDTFQKTDEALQIDLKTEVVIIGPLTRDDLGGGAHAETYFDDYGLILLKERLRLHEFIPEDNRMGREVLQHALLLSLIQHVVPECIALDASPLGGPYLNVIDFIQYFLSVHSSLQSLQLLEDEEGLVLEADRIGLHLHIVHPR